MSSSFDEAIQAYGKEIDVQIDIGGTTYTSADCIEANPHFEGTLYSTVMKCLNLKIMGQLTLNTDAITRFAFGVKAPEDASYYYRDYGSYIIKETKYDVATNTTELECYDKMLQAMIPYDLELDYTNGQTVLQLLQAICSRLGWTLASSNFVNASVVIPKEPFNSEYTFRAVLEEIAQITGSVIAFEPTGKLMVKYPHTAEREITTDNLKSVEVGEYYGWTNSLVLARTPQEDNIYRQDEQSIAEDGLCEIKFENNQIVEVLRAENESGGGNEDYIDALCTEILGRRYCTFTLESFGIGNLKLCEIFYLHLDDEDEDIKCVCLNDDLKITQGLSESLHFEKPEETTTDYKTATKTDRMLAQTIFRVDKQENEIKSLVSDVQGNSTAITQSATNFNINVKNAVKDDIDGIKEDVEDIQKDLEANFVFDTNGLTIKTGGTASTFTSTFSGNEWAINEAGNKVTWVTNETLHSKNAEIENTLTIGGIVKVVPVDNNSNKGIGFVGIV